MLMLNVYKVFVVKTEPRLHFGVQCNVNVGSSGGCLRRKLLHSLELYSLPLTERWAPWWVGPTPLKERGSIVSNYAKHPCLESLGLL